MNGEYKIGDVVLGNWTLVKLLGEGSYGRVYEAHREDFGTTYTAAIKIMTIPASQSEVDNARAEGMDEESVTAYFNGMVKDVVQEFALMSELKGTANIVSYEDHAVTPLTDGIGWDVLIRMELLTPMLKYMSSHKMTRSDIIKLGIDMCKALELCQRYNIIHRDIKPENIFISRTGDYKLGDFGVARTLEKTTGGLSKKGTYTYMAPEVYKNEKYGSTVDIYSLGIVLYRLLNNNRAPFLPAPPQPISYREREQALERRISGEPLLPPANAEGRLAEIVLKACAYHSKDRYTSPLQMRQELEAIQYEKQNDALIYGENGQIFVDKTQYTRNSHTSDTDNKETAQENSEEASSAGMDDDARDSDTEETIFKDLNLQTEEEQSHSPEELTVLRAQYQKELEEENRREEKKEEEERFQKQEEERRRQEEETRKKREKRYKELVQTLQDQNEILHPKEKDHVETDGSQSRTDQEPKKKLPVWRWLCAGAAVVCIVLFIICFWKPASSPTPAFTGTIYTLKMSGNSTVSVTTDSTTGKIYASKVYDGTPLIPTGDMFSLADINGNTVSDYTFTLSYSPNKSPTTVSDGSVDITYNVTELRDASSNVVAADQYTVIPVTLTLSISKRPLTLSANSANKVYDGNALTLTAPGYTVTDGSLAADESITAISVTGSRIRVGSAQSKIKTDSTVIKKADGTETTDNYQITLNPGTLEVTTYSVTPITVSVGKVSKVYDGTPLTLSSGNVQVLSGTLPAGSTISADFSTASRTDAGSDSVNITYISIRDAAGNDITNNYSINRQSGTLTVTKRPLMIETYSSTKEYDGNPLTNMTTPAVTGRLDGDQISLKITGSQTNIGSSLNTISDVKITHAANQQDVTDNYLITYKLGRLTVTEDKSYAEPTPIPTSAPLLMSWEEGNWYWSLTEGVLTITGVGNMKNYENGADVPWYLQRSSVNQVIVKEGITGIGDCAFYDCENLKSVTFPDSVTFIGKQAFHTCVNLTSVTIPENVSIIGSDAFCFCKSLTSVTIPDGVTSIGEYAFGWCSGLMSVTIPNGVTSIGSDAFCFCKSLTNVTIPDSVTTIEAETFIACESLRDVTIPDSVTSIGKQAFDYCSNLTDIHYVGTEEQWAAIVIGEFNAPLLNATIHTEALAPEILPKTVDISAREFNTYALRSDGTVAVSGPALQGQGDVREWRNIVKIDAGYVFVLGLTEDGKVLLAGNAGNREAYNLLQSVSDWTDIVDISAGLGFAIGLKRDGTVVTAGSLWNNDNYNGWNEIIAFEAGDGYAYGVLSNGSIVDHANRRYNNWENIVSVKIGSYNTGDNRSFGSFLIALREDGTVVSDGKIDISDWTGITAVAAGRDFVVGLRADGTVVAAGINNYGQCDVSNWTDIVAIAVGEDYTVGLKADGTVLAVGNNSYGQCEQPR